MGKGKLGKVGESGDQLGGESLVSLNFISDFELSAASGFAGSLRNETEDRLGEAPRSAAAMPPPFIRALFGPAWPASNKAVAWPQHSEGALRRESQVSG